MTTPPNDGWIEWEGPRGAKCPVASQAMVELRTDSLPLGTPSFIAGEVQWDNTKRSNKLRAYRVQP